MMPEKKRVLLVDDEASFTRLMKLNLETNGPYEVRVESDPGKAVAAAREFRPNVIFLDVIMPETDGGTVASELGADPGLKSIPIVFLTAVVSKNEVLQHGDKFGGRIFLAKPVSVADVIQTIEKVAV
jgi:CheY-like chemotaxis protein